MTVRNDLDIYERHADEWWDPRSPRFRSLHALNPFRLELIEGWVGDELAGHRIIDLGCGGGLLAEPLAARGATVVGLDRSAASVAAARRHAAGGAGRPTYLRGDLLAVPFEDATFDGVLLADVLEHLDDPAAAVAEAARVLRPGGWLYASTIDRTWRARVLVVHVAEGIGLVPRGTHDPRLFVPPAELDRAARDAGLELVDRVGEAPALWRTLRGRAIRLRRARSTAIAYSAFYRRSGGALPGGKP